MAEPAPSRPVAAPLRCSNQNSGVPDKNDESLGCMAPDVLEAHSLINILIINSYDKELNNLVGVMFRTYGCFLT